MASLDAKVSALFVVGDESTTPGHYWWVLRMAGVAVFGSTDEELVEAERTRLYDYVLTVMR